MKKIILYCLFMLMPAFAFAISSDDCPQEKDLYENQKRFDDPYIYNQYDQHLKNAIVDLSELSTLSEANDLKDGIENGQKNLLKEAKDPLEIAFRKLYMCLSELRVEQVMHNLSLTETKSQSHHMAQISESTTHNTVPCSSADAYANDVGNWMNTQLATGSGALSSLAITAGGLEAIIHKYEASCPQSPALKKLRDAYKTALDGCAQLTSGSDQCSPIYPDSYQNKKIYIENSASNQIDSQIAALINQQQAREDSVKQTQRGLRDEANRLVDQSLENLRNAGQPAQDKPDRVVPFSESSRRCGRICTAN